MKIKIFLALAAMAFALPAAAQTYDTNGDYVQTFAGYGEQGYLDGQGLLTKFSNPSQIVADTSINLYVWDSGNSRIRKITPAGIVSTLAGGGYDYEGEGTNVSFSLYGTIGAMAMDHSNTIWLAAYGGNVYPATQYLLNVQTNGWVAIENGGTGLSNLTASSGICFDSANNLYYSGGNMVWRYSSATGDSEPFAGNGSAGYADGNGTVFPEFNAPTALACDQANNLYVWDSENYRIRRIDQSQNVTTYAGNGSSFNADGDGTNASFGTISQMVTDNSGNLYVVCGPANYYYNSFIGTCVRKISAQTNTVTLAGNFSQSGYTNGPGAAAAFNGADGACLSGGIIYVADANNQRIRDITFNPQPQVLSGASLGIGTYAGVSITGIVGRTYQIQSSPDLNNWTTEATILLTSSPYLWIDQNPIAGNKYYQALLLP